MVAECKSLKNLSLKELNYKLYSKGISKEEIENYMSLHGEELVDYEINSALNIIRKKMNTSEWEDVANYLYKKGYLEETINIARKQYEEE